MAVFRGTSDDSFLVKYRGWFMVLIVFVEVFIVCGPNYNFSILFVSLQEEFDAGAALTGWVGSLSNALIGAGCPISSPLLQRFGPRAMTLVGAVIFAGGLVATSFVPLLTYAYVTFGIFVGLGAHFIYQSGVQLLYDWFPTKHCSRAFSLALLGASFSVLAFAPLLSSLITAYGWRNALRILGGGCLVISFAFGVFTLTPPEVYSGALETYSNRYTVDHTGVISKIDKITDVDDGALETNVKGLTVDHTSEIPQVDKVTNERNHVDNCKTSRQRFVEILFLVDTWLWALCLILSFLGWTFVIVNYASFMEYDLRFTTDQTTIVIMLLAVGDIAGKVLLSIFADSLPFMKLYVVVAAALLGAVSAGVLTVVRTFPFMCAVSLSMGLFRAASNAASFAATMEIFREHGTNAVSMLSMMPYGVGIFIGAPLSGGLYDLTGDYTLSLLAIMGIFVGSAIVAMIIPIRLQIKSNSSECYTKASKDKPVSTVVSLSENVKNNTTTWKTNLKYNA